MTRKSIFKISAITLSGFLLIWLVGLTVVPRVSLIGKKTDLRVHLALGFHGNLYHSYRIDTNDEAGFGKDIRIIRKVIEVLDNKNRDGIPVKAVWDFENLFSLEETLPRYAPDIIRNMKRRVAKNGDEVILMSYNNALASVLTEREFRDSMRLSISNGRGSGVADLFGKWSPYVRPQEMMITPGNYRLYKELGIKGVVLYYSAIPFDAFRVFERELSIEEAHNPLLYRNSETGEEMLIIPAYNHGDLAENISIRRWVRNLHREQLRGTIKRDVLLFINTDADDSYWYGYKLPPYLAWLPNTGGLSQLVDDVADLDYVRFTTIDEYVRTHAPAGKISFGQDAADGSFNGYVSWAEKSYSSDYWSRIESDRRTHELVKAVYANARRPVPGDVKASLDKSFEKRMRLLSTTNFGMATPFLARTRERVVEKIIDELKCHSAHAGDRAMAFAKERVRAARPPVNEGAGKKYIDSLLIMKQKNNPPGAGFILSLPHMVDPAGEYFLEGKDGKAVPLMMLPSVPAGDAERSSRFYVPGGQMGSGGFYNLYQDAPGGGNEKYHTEATAAGVRNAFIEIRLDKNGHVEGVYREGVRELMEESFLPSINYGGKKYGPRKLTVRVEKDGRKGVVAVRLEGELTLPVEGTRPGKIDYLLCLVDGVPSVFIDAAVSFPDTPRGTVFKPGVPALARLYDPAWREVAPCEIRFARRADKTSPFRVLKRNFLGVESSYPIDYFRHSRKNLDLANVNNHITSEYAALTGKGNGIAVAMDTTVLSNFAFCPLKIDYDWWNGFRASLNPFGTWFGDQYYQPTWSNGQGFAVALLTGDQYHTAACTYSGYSSRFSLMVSFFKGDAIPVKEKQALISFARPPFTAGLRGGGGPLKKNESLSPTGFLGISGDGGVYFHWEKPAAGAKGYRVYCGKEPGSYTRKYTQAGSESTLFVKEFSGGEPFRAGRTYYASLGVLDGMGIDEGPRSREIRFTVEPQKRSEMKLPVMLQVKILWATIVSLID